jgi:hypothetical protein
VRRRAPHVERGKLEALRNAIVNSATKTEPDQDERHIFVQVVDRFTPLHLRILKAFQDPLRWAREHEVKYSPASARCLDHFIEKAFPELRGHRTFCDLVWSELRQARLITAADLEVMMTKTGWQTKRTTGLGDKFLAFTQCCLPP